MAHAGEGVAGPNQQVPAHRGVGRVVSGGWRRGATPSCARGSVIGLEFGGEGCVDAMRGVASSGGFPMLENPDQYAEWRYMGVEG